MSSLTWPDPNKIHRLNQIILETQLNPFGIATYKSGQPVNDFVGRQEELNRFKEEIKKVIQYKQSRAVRLEGPPGVGKSTLFNYLKESIEKERAGETASSIRYLLNDIDIFSTYFVLPDQIVEFASIWKPLCEGLCAGFDKETGNDISLPEYVAFHLIFRMFQRDPTKLASIIWSKSPAPTPLHTARLRDIISPIRKGGTATIKQLQDYFNENKRELREELISNIAGDKAELKRTDNQLIINLFRTIDEDDPELFLEKVQSGSHEIFKTNEDLVSYFNDLCRIYTCASKKQPVFLIGIDEFAKSDMTNRTEYYIQLGNLMVKLRNSLNNILFTFISTSEDWQNYDAVIKNNVGLAGQISGFMTAFEVISLSTDELKQVFRNRMNRFWMNYSSDQSQLAPFYPFSENVFEYVYLYHKRQLRESINFLGEMWSHFHYNGNIPKMETIFEALREVRRIENKALDPTSIQRFEWNIIAKAFNDPQRFSSNGARSASIETGMELAWKCLSEGQFPEITKVENNPTITTSSGKRRPDVYLTIHGNLGAEYRRQIEFQIKAYSPNSFVELKHIESSIELFTEHYTDFIYFIITGKGLSPDAEAKVKEIEQKYPTRIRRPALNEHQMEALYLMAIYEDVFGETLKPEPNNEKIAKYLLENVLNQKIEDFIAEIRRLAFRQPLLTNLAQNVEISPSIIHPSSVKTIDQILQTVTEKPIKPPPPQSGLDSIPEISNKTTDQSTSFLQKPKIGARWLEKYPNYNTYRHELCALLDYLRTRENTANHGKFTVTTVDKNVFGTNVSLDRKKLKPLINQMQRDGYLVPEKTSFKLTPEGEILYAAVKVDHFNC